MPLTSNERPRSRTRRTGPGELTIDGGRAVRARRLRGRRRQRHGRAACRRGRGVRVHAVRGRRRLADRDARRAITLSVVAPTDATVGDEVPLRVSVHGRAARVEVRVLDPPAAGGAPRSRPTGIVPHRRDAARRLRPRPRADPHLGAARRLRADASGPDRAARSRSRSRPGRAPRRCRRSDPVPPRVERRRSTSITGPAVDVVRAVRPYVAGDAARLVHWPTSARRGELVVREHDPPANDGVALVVDLSGPQRLAEDGREPAPRASAARCSHGAGGSCSAPASPTGPVCASVADRATSGGASPAAVGGPPAPAPDGWPAMGRATRRAPRR